MGCLKLHNYTTLQIAHTSNTARSREDKRYAGLYKYKFGNKELQDELGLNAYDFGARMYMPDIVRTPIQDPLTAEFPNMSPYCFFNNNPLRFTDPTGMAPDDWIVHTGKDGKQQITYDVGVKTVEQAQAQGYQNVTNVFESGTGRTANNNEVFSFQSNGQYSINGNSYDVANGGQTTQGGTYIAENPIGRTNMFLNGAKNTLFGVVGTIGAIAALPETGGASGLAVTLTAGEVGIGISQMANAFERKPSDVLNNYGTVPGMIAGQRGSQYAPLIEGVSSWAPGSMSGGNIMGTIDAFQKINRGEKVLYNTAGIIDASLDAQSYGSGLNDTYNKIKK
jgi:RHS repeat-associated protein